MNDSDHITAVWSEPLWGLRKTVLATTSKRAIEQWRPMAQQKHLYLHHQGEFQHQNCTVGTVHDSDHEGVVRIFVGHSYHSNELLFMRHNFSPTRSVMYRYEAKQACTHGQSGVSS